MYRGWQSRFDLGIIETREGPLLQRPLLLRQARSRLSSHGAGAMTVFVYVNTAKQVGDIDHIKVFSTVDAAEAWFEENDPEGVAFEYDVMGLPA